MRCWLCRRTLDDDWRFVTLPDGRTGRICWRCWEKGDVDIPVSYEEDEDDD
jgi:hypothetical protein